MESQSKSCINQIKSRRLRSRRAGVTVRLYLGGCADDTVLGGLVRACGCHALGLEDERRRCVGHRLGQAEQQVLYLTAVLVLVAYVGQHLVRGLADPAGRVQQVLSRLQKKPFFRIVAENSSFWFIQSDMPVGNPQKKKEKTNRRRKGCLPHGFLARQHGASH